MTPVPAHGIASALVAEAARTLTGLVPVRPAAGRTAVPRDFLIAPRLLREADPDRTRDIYQGTFLLAGIRMKTGTQSPFLLADAPPAWRRAVAGFTWLGDLAATNSELARVQARCLIADWISVDGKRRGPGWELEVIAERLTSWLGHAPFYLANAGEDFQDRLMASIGRQMRHLGAALPHAAHTWSGLRAAVAYASMVLCADGLEKLSGRAGEALGRALELQLLPDGGHISRNPNHIVDLLEALLPLKHCYAEREIDPPQEMLNAIDRLFPLLRMFLHGDNGLAFFNGASTTRRRAIAAILARDCEAARPLRRARQSGYARLAQGKTVIIADTGTAPTPRAGGCGHAGTLSFEMSHGTQRIIVNCGHAVRGPEEWLTATRSSAAHSTLVIAERCSSRIMDGALTRRLFGGPITFGPRNVSGEVKAADAGELLSAMHDGYARAFGLVHRREIYVATSGTDIRGEDRLDPAPGAGRERPHPFAIHFHLHPSVKATLSQDGGHVLLLLPDKSGWRFSSRGAAIRLEESVCFMDRDIPHHTTQIVLCAETSRISVVKWALKRIDKASAGGKAPSPAPTRLPLKGGGMN